MLAQLPTLIVRFDINKISSAAYGFYCWKILCKAVELNKMRSSLLFDGDSAETLNGHENVFCIGFQTLFSEQLITLQSKLSKDSEFLNFCAASPFLEGPRAHQEPLVASGRIDAEGRLSEDADSAKEAIASSQKPKGLNQNNMIQTLLALFCVLFWIKICKDWLSGMRRMTILKNYTKVVPLIDFPLISVIVPACNEEKKIRMTLESLMKQEYPNLEIIAVNDRSTDSTGKILNDLAKRHTLLKVIHIDSLPPDWLGKNHALYSGASHAQGEWLLFTDADIFFERSSIQLAFNYAYAHHLDHLTMAPDVIVSGPLLKAFVNAFSLIFSLLVKPWLARDSTKREHVGIGAFNLMKRSVYNAIGGHQAIHLRPDDDMKIGKLVKKHGFKQDIVIGKDILRVEWYENLRQAARGLEKNTLSGVDYKISRMFLGTLFLFITNVYPWIGIWTGPFLSRILFGISLLIFLSLFTYHEKYIESPLKASFGDAFLHPAGMLIALYIMNRACLKTFFQGEIEWRGTKYSLEILKKNTV